MKLLCEVILYIIELYKNYFSCDMEVHACLPLFSPMFIFTVKFDDIISWRENVPQLTQC